MGTTAESRLHRPGWAVFYVPSSGRHEYAWAPSARDLVGRGNWIFLDGALFEEVRDAVELRDRMNVAIHVMES